MKIAKQFATAVTITVLLAGCAANAPHESTGQYIDSAVITTKVKAALLRDPSIHSTPITVNTYKDRVQLSGFVRSVKQKKRAADIARGIAGVSAVDNNLIVRN